MSFIQECVNQSVRNHASQLLCFVGLSFTRQQHIDMLAWLEQRFPDEFDKAKWAFVQKEGDYLPETARSRQHSKRRKAEKLIAFLKDRGFVAYRRKNELVARHHNAFFPDRTIGHLSELSQDDVEIWTKRTSIQPTIE